jgi:hypothetical protein
MMANNAPPAGPDQPPPPPINPTFSRALLQAQVEKFPTKGKSRTPTTVKSIMSGVTCSYAHVMGIEKTNTFDDLTCITLDNLKKVSKSLKLQPLYAECANGSCTKPVKNPRRYLEDCRNVLFAAQKYLSTLDGDYSGLIKTLQQNYLGFNKECDRLKDAEDLRKAERRMTEHEAANWINWNDLKNMVTSAYLYIENALNGLNDDINERKIPEVKKLQSALMVAMYTLLPPVRNNYPGLRFVEVAGAFDESSGQSLEEYLTTVEAEFDQLKTLKCPNYVLVPKDGAPMELVINRFKSDRRTKNKDYDPTTDYVLDHEHTVRIKLADDAILQKYGFDPKRIGDYLRRYRAMGLFANRNPDELIFYDVNQRKAGSPAPRVKAIGPEGTKSRLLRFTGKLNAMAQTAANAQNESYSGAEQAKLACKMFRTTFVTWFNEQDPTAEERVYIAKCMMHSATTALNNYTKRPAGSKRRSSFDDGPARKRSAA